jgi:hypothetical protein
VPDGVERRGGGRLDVALGRLGNSWARQGFPLCNQLRFSRCFARLFTRSGFRIGNAARNNFAAISDDFPIPATVLVIGHNAKFNVASHVALGSPPARNDFQNKLGHYVMRRN